LLLRFLVAFFEIRTGKPFVAGCACLITEAFCQSCDFHEPLTAAPDAGQQTQGACRSLQKG
jgi:hypothetical protein